MRKRLFLGAVIGALSVFLASLAWANPVADTNLDLTVKASSKKGGSKKKPTSQKITVTWKGSTKSGTGQPSNTTVIKFGLPKEWVLNTKKWPQKKACDLGKAESDKSKCPRGSKVGTGKSQALAANGAITQNLNVTAFVGKRGGLGFFVEGSQPVEVAAMLPGKISRSRNLTVQIPSNIQEPAPGVLTGITLLNVKFGGSTKDGRKKVNLLESKGCKKKKWSFTSSFTYRDGSLKAPATVKCRK